jgi:hypothetical protein
MTTHKSEIDAITADNKLLQAFENSGVAFIQSLGKMQRNHPELENTA